VFKLSAYVVSQHIALVPGKIFSASQSRALPSYPLWQTGDDELVWSLKLLGELVKKQLK
jgi:hypothetical protein